MNCAHCGNDSTQGWTEEEIAQMKTDNAYPPHACGACWTTVAAKDIDTACDDPANCSHVVRSVT